MNTPTQLDLSYADPAPSPDFLQRTRQQGRAIKRRRRAGAATAGVATAALVGVLTLQLAGGPADQREVTDPAATSAVDLSTLPVSTGSDPSITYDSHSIFPSGEDIDVGSSPIVVGTDSQGKQSLIWVTPLGSLCDGTRDSATAEPAPSSCSPLEKAPAEGLWASQISSGSKGGSEPLAPLDTTIYGVVRGPVTRVVIDLPVSGAVDAALAPAPNGLGTIYYLLTRDFTINSRMDFSVAGSDESIGSPAYGYTAKVTVYRGDTPVFHCEYDDCIIDPSER